MEPDQHLLSALLQLTDTLVTRVDIIDVLNTVTAASTSLLNAAAAGVLLEDQRGGLQPIATSSDRAEIRELFELQSHQGPSLDCYRSGAPVRNLSTDHATHRWPDLGSAFRTAGVCTIHALPLQVRGHTIGAVSLLHADPHPLDAHDTALAQALADLATIGLIQDPALSDATTIGAHLQGALNSRILIEQAKGALSERHAITIEAAYQLLRQHARRAGQPMATLAAAVLQQSGTATGITPHPQS